MQRSTFMLALTIFIWSLPLYTANAAMAPCTVQSAGKSLVTVQMRDRTIDLVGWDHPEPEDVNKMMKAYSAALVSARNRQCGRARMAIDQLFQSAPQLLSRPEFVYKSLEGINSAAPLTFIARETSPEEWKSYQKEYDAVEKDLQEIEDLCPNQLTSQLDKVRLAGFGPERAFSKHHSGAAIDGIESLRECKLICVNDFC